MSLLKIIVYQETFILLEILCPCLLKCLQWFSLLWESLLKMVGRPPFLPHLLPRISPISQTAFRPWSYHSVAYILAFFFFVLVFLSHWNLPFSAGRTSSTDLVKASLNCCRCRLRASRGSTPFPHHCTLGLSEYPWHMMDTQNDLVTWIELHGNNTFKYEK